MYLYGVARDRLCGLVVRVPGYRSRGPGFDSRRYQIFWEIMGLERGPLSLLSTIEELLGRNSSGSGLESREYGRGDPLRWPRDTLYPQKLALTSPTCGGRSVGIVLLRTKATEFVVYGVARGHVVYEWPFRARNGRRGGPVRSIGPEKGNCSRTRGRVCFSTLSVQPATYFHLGALLCWKWRQYVPHLADYVLYSARSQYDSSLLWKP
jgi:hypothetical protein